MKLSLFLAKTTASECSDCSSGRYFLGLPLFLAGVAAVTGTEAGAGGGAGSSGTGGDGRSDQTILTAVTVPSAPTITPVVCSLEEPRRL